MKATDWFWGFFKSQEARVLTDVVRSVVDVVEAAGVPLFVKSNITRYYNGETFARRKEFPG